MSENGQPQLSLLSLSIAAANAAPISPSPLVESASRASHATNTTKHRRLSSAGRSRRRLSDARDAATRPFPASLQTASASLAALSLSPPTVSQRQVPGGAQPVQVPLATSAKGASDPEPGSVDDASSPSHTPLASNSVNVAKQGRKRGTIFTCESCSKVYRHPSCLIKHRWEHTPQWREASKFVLSKHQQVQLLEAAAILSHLSPSSASLPEDRSLWPSFLSGGLVPPPASVPNSNIGSTPTATTAISLSHSASNDNSSFSISSSVPASAVGFHLGGSTEPRLHNYALGAGETGVAQIRPEKSSVPISPATTADGGSSPMSVPEDDALNLLALHSASVSASAPLSSLTHVHTRSQSQSHAYSRSRVHAHSHSLSLSDAPSKERERRSSNAYEYGFLSGSGAGSCLGNGQDYKSSGYAYAPNSNGGWYLPRSSVRSKSGSSRSRSGSQSVSESRSDEEDEVDFSADLEDGSEGGIDGEGTRRAKLYGSHMRLRKAEEEDEDALGGVTRISLREDAEEDAEDVKGPVRIAQTWDGMEMEMEMD